MASAASALSGDTSSDRLGATMAPLDRETRAALNIGEDVQGVVITDLDGDGHAAEAGLRVGDVILQVAGKPVRSTADVEKALKDAPADAVLIQIARGDARIFVGVRLA